MRCVQGHEWFERRGRREFKVGLTEGVRVMMAGMRLGVSSRRGGFSLVELLIVIGIVGLLTSILLPALRNVREQAALVQCLSNLRSIASASLSYSVDDPRNLLIPVHPTADHNALYDDGYFDFGGGSGSAEMWRGARVGAQSERRADTRPLNTWLGLTGLAQSGYALFACPRDQRFDPPRDFGNWIIWDPLFREQSASRLVGTSYWANASKGKYGRGGRKGPTVSIGPWLRPVTRIPYPSQTVLYMEMPVAFSLEYSWSGDRVRFTFAGHPGWHAGETPRYNLALCDGSAATFAFAAGSLNEEQGPEHTLRLSTIRFDCDPDAPIVDLPLPGMQGQPATPGG